MFIYFTYIPVLLILLLLFFIFFSFKKNISRKIFSFFILSIAIWVFTLIFADSGKDYNTVLLWTRLAIAGPIIAIYLLVIFSFVFPSLKPKFTLKKAIYLSFPALVMLFFINTNHNVESITIERWGSNPQPGFLYNVLLIYVVVYLIIALRNFYKSYKENTGIYKKQIVYLFIGLIFFISTAVFTNLLSILFNFAQYSIYGPISSLFFIGCVGYAISRYRLMDIRIVLRKSMVMIAVLVTIVGGAGIITYANSMYWNLMRPMWMGMLTMVIGLALYEPIKEKYLKIANNYFFTSLETYQKAIEKVTSDLTSTIEIDKIIHSIIDSITKAMGLEKVCVLTIKHYEKDRYSFDIEKASGFNEGDIAKIIRDELLVNYFKDHKKILVVEEVLREMEEHKEKKNYYTKIERLEETLKELDVSICLPLFAKGKLNGMIVLGNKVSKDAYTVQDLELLKTMSDQAAVAMENAQLYEKVQDLNINLKKKVEEATAEINEKNKNLKELLEMKSDFLTVASHQLRTPTSIVRGMLSMLNEDENKMSPKARRDFISQAYGAANNLEHIINDLLSATELEGGKVEYNIEPLDAVEVVEGVVKERGFMAKDKKLKLVLKESKKKLPMVLADPHKLKEVVNNLVDNAIYYTPKGEIEVGFKSGKGELEIYVKDQGIGLSPEDKDKIFGRFIRGDRSLSVNPNGTGLGLYIVDQCIQAMNGRVIAESEGINKGTTFSIFLPSLIE